MRARFSTRPPQAFETPLLVFPLLPQHIASLARSEALEGVAGLLDHRTGGALARAVKGGDFRAKAGDELLAYADPAQAGPLRVLFLGCGGDADPAPEDWRAVAGRATRAASRLKTERFALSLTQLGGRSRSRKAAVAQAAAEGAWLASWRYGERKSREGPDDEGLPPAEATFLAGGSEEWRRGAELGRVFARAENFARTLQAMPGNDLTPARLAEMAEEAARKAGLKAEAWGPSRLRREQMGALLSVAKGSDEEPRLIVLEHEGQNADAAPLVLVGKGLTFDSGGVSLKPAKGMERMKYDMSGGAAVVAAMCAIAELDWPLRVVGLVPASENMVNGSANKPGDIVRSRAGKWVEIVNTDAEGRLILADALDYATGLQPAAIVDCATLTGACVVALGRHRSGLLSNNSELASELAVAGERADQPVWRLPLDPGYGKQLKSPFADLRNVGGRGGGAITAGWFLSEFARGVPWAHLDIAGTAYGKTDRAYLREGPFGVPCRLLLEWVRLRAGV